MTTDTTGRCGSTAGYQRHRRAGTEPCDACRKASSRDHNVRMLLTMQGTPPTVPALGTQRRIRALMRLGWTSADIAPRMGSSPEYVQYLARDGRSRVWRKTAEQVDAAFRSMCMTPGPSTITTKRAEKKGWAPPLAWDDIDDPNETPQGFGTFCESTHTEAGRRRAHSAYVRGDRSPASIAGEREYQRLRRRAKRAEKAS